MARTQLKVLRGRHGSYEVATRELTSKGKAPESIDPSVIVRRARAAEVAQATLAAGYFIPTKKGKKSLRVFFQRPILARDFKYIEESAVAAGLLTAATQMPDETVKCGSFRFLTETSKMGCYSFNLPAGPTVQGGTCPAASLGFMYLSEGELREQRRLTPMPISVPDFICNGCYALKSGYAYTSTVLIQALQLELVKLWLREGSFVKHMVTFIRAGQEASRTSMKRTPRELWHNIPNPNFFRIHDAGDMFNRKYFDAWVEICKSLPDVHFWAPTRMWALPGAAGVRFSKGMPSNLALRPSSLHWRTEPPPVQSPGTAHASLFGQSYPMLSAGSGSGVHAPAGVWECPAYEHMTKLGGSVSKLGPEGQELRDKKGELLTKDGNCGRAHGPNSPARGGSDPHDLPEAQGGHGCRACWINKDVPIYYHEH